QLLLPRLHAFTSKHAPSTANTTLSHTTLFRSLRTKTSSSAWPKAETSRRGESSATPNSGAGLSVATTIRPGCPGEQALARPLSRSEEHTSELHSRCDHVYRPLLERNNRSRRHT